jgi:hypothetical protein
MTDKPTTTALPSRLLTNPKFRYVPAVKTDIRRTWRKARLLMHLQRRGAPA